MWSLTLQRVGRTSGAKKFRSSARKDFFDSIDPKATFGATAKPQKFSERYIFVVVALAASAISARLHYSAASLTDAIFVGD
jgi:hypothetical protein